MNPLSNFKAAINRDDEDDDQLYKHDKRLTRQLQFRRVNDDISKLLRTMATAINLNKRADFGAGDIAGAGRSQLTINLNRRPDVDYRDDEGLTQHYHGKIIKHFSHPHNLSNYNFQQLSRTNCKICGLQLVGSGYGCQSCQFYVHTSCFDLPQKIQHDAHRAHPLTLSYPSYYKHSGKACNGCCGDCERSHLYCCDLCHFVLHVTCATLSNFVKCADGSTLRLYYTFPLGDRIVAPCCNVCYRTVSKKGWLYYNKDDHRMTHINCSKGKPSPDMMKERLTMLKIK